jgi:hypothetical protein
MHALGLALATMTALRAPAPLSPRIANYQIDAKLDESKHTVTGHARLDWRNTGSGDVKDLVFHLYMNAFKNESSAFMRESKGRHRSSEMAKGGWGMITVKKLTVRGKDLTASFKVDDTLGTVTLLEPVAAGAGVQVDIDFETLMPKVFARTGYHEDFYAIAQWFPKIGVWDCGGGACRWRAHQHHLNSEFFADFGVYDVSFDVPARYHTAATGVPVGQADSIGPDRKIVRWHAEDVHDFVLFAYPKFRQVEETHRAPWGEVQIVLMTFPGHEANVPRHLAATHAGLDELARRFGPYPYSRITVVDVPRGADGAGGMEYPTLFTTFDAPVPLGLRFPEMVTMHEFAHQYFCQMVATDEVEEAWLDEGLTETMTDFGLSRMFGRAGSAWSVAGHRMSLVEMERLRFRRSIDVDPPETISFQFLDNFTYGGITYSKTNALLRTLEAYLGEATFEKALRRYYEDWQFKHPRVDDFTKSFDAGAGQDLSWFWNATLRGTQVLDYEVLQVDVRDLRAPAGLFDTDGGVREVPKDKSKKVPFISEVVVHKRGEMTFPVSLRVVFADGSEKRESWDGKDRWKRFIYEGEQKVAYAQLDPDDKIPLDVRRWNNGLRAEPDSAARSRITSGFGAFVSALIAAVGF